MKDVRYDIFPTILLACNSPAWWIVMSANTCMFKCFHVFFLSDRKDFLRADGK
jgi:hypothetical protein